MRCFRERPAAAAACARCAPPAAGTTPSSRWPTCSATCGCCETATTTWPCCACWPRRWSESPMTACWRSGGERSARPIFTAFERDELPEGLIGRRPAAGGRLRAAARAARPTRLGEVGLERLIDLVVAEHDYDLACLAQPDGDRRLRTWSSSRGWPEATRPCAAPTWRASSGSATSRRRWRRARARRPPPRRTSRRWC